MSDKFKDAIRNYLDAIQKLKDLNIITNKRDFTSQIGEWFVEEIFEGERAKSANQKDWDLIINGQKVQVKAHSKASTTKAKWTAIHYEENAEIDVLITIIFSPDYELLEIYKTPWSEAYKLIKQETHRRVLYWNDQRKYRINHEDLPKQDVVKIFKKKTIPNPSPKPF